MSEDPFASERRWFAIGIELLMSQGESSDSKLDGCRGAELDGCRRCGMGLASRARALVAHAPQRPGTMPLSTEAI